MNISINQTLTIEPLQNPKYYLASVAFFRDEDRFLKEWIEFYKLMGVEHFYLFNHLSVDNSMKVLEPYIQEGIVEVTDVTYEPKSPQEWRAYVQLKTYTDISNTLKDKVEWLIFVDTDEYLYPVVEENIPQALKKYDNFASVAVNWRLFGSNSVQRVGEEELLIEKLVKHESAPNLHVKSIIKPRYVENFPYSHCANLKSGFHAVTENFQPIDGPHSLVPSYNVFAVNHYLYRDLDFFKTNKLARTHFKGNNDITQENTAKINKLVEQNNNYSTVYDDRILKFAPALRKQMFKEKDTEFVSSKLIDIAGDKKLGFLPNNISYVIPNAINFPYSVKHGYGYEPGLLKKILDFIKEGENYLEIGSGYGELAMQVASELGTNSKIYAYESDKSLYEYLSTNVFINAFSNLELENKIPANIHADVIRINSAGNECNLIKKTENILENQRWFVKVQSSMEECLAELSKQGFIFIDINKFNEECSYLSYQQDYRLSAEDALINKEVLILKEEAFEYFRKLSSNTESCKELANQILFNAATLGENEYVKLALLGGADINYYPDVLFGTALYYAIGANRVDTIELLIKEGADIELGFQRKVPPLFFAVDEGHAEIVELLLKSGAKIGGINPVFESSALDMAVNKSFFEIAKLLLEYGANPNVATPKTGYIPLYETVLNNNYNMTKLLLEYHSNYEFSLDSGSTPLFAASYFGYETIVELLIKHGANKNVQVQGVNMISAALHNNHTSTAIILAGSQDNFCQLIQHSEYETKYAELCGENKLDL